MDPRNTEFTPVNVVFRDIIERKCDYFNEVGIRECSPAVRSPTVKTYEENVPLFLRSEWAWLNQTIPFISYHTIIAWLSEKIAVKLESVENALDTDQVCNLTVQRLNLER